MNHQVYTKINTLYKRDPKGNIMMGEYSRPEFEYLRNVKWMAYEKIDGTNMSYYWDGHNLEIHGKTEQAQIPKPLLEYMQKLITPEKMAEVFPLKYDENGNEIPMQVIIYGEGFGKGIQGCGGRYHRNDVEFRVFDINIDGWWLEIQDVRELTLKLNLGMAIYFGDMTIDEAEEFVKKGFYSAVSEDTELIAEGLVLRPMVQLFNRRGERIMVKIKYRDYPH